MKIIKVLILLVIVVGVIAGSWWVNITKSFDKPILSDTEVYFSIEEGATLTSVAYDLEESDIIADSNDLIWLSRLEGGKAVLAANYEFPVGFTLRDVYNAITNGESLSEEAQVTLIEGWTLKEMSRAIVDAKLAEDVESFIASAKELEKYSEDYSSVSGIPETGSLEGYLFPDTYRFFADASNHDVIVKLLSNFESKLDDQMKADIAETSLTLHQIITLASIIEAEVPNPDDMKVISGIFHNRLEMGMALQADSTINYLTESGRDRSTAEDLEIDSPYNTYKYPGLPPGPIGNPGLNAITAAIYPDETNYLYFLTDKAGRVYYGETFAEHQHNRQFLDRE